MSCRPKDLQLRLVRGERSRRAMLVHVEQLGPITLNRLAEAMVVDRATTLYR